MTFEPVHYRRATSEDAWELIGVHYAAVHSIGKGVYPDVVLFAWSPPPDEPRRKQIADLIAQDHVICIVAECEARTVAFGIALPAQGWIRALYVHPDHGGKGIGQRLLHGLEVQCQSVGVAALEVKASHNAEGFYRRCGYEVVGPASQELTTTLSMAAVHMVKRFVSGR